MPSGATVVSCPAPFGVGGLGRHLMEIAHALDRRGQERAIICEGSATEPARPAPGRPPVAWLSAALAPAARFSPAWRIWNASVSFDARAAGSLPAAEHFIGFNGTSLYQLSRARTRMQTAALVSANSHYRRVVRQHERAHRQYPVERPWVTRLLRRNLLEYQRVDRIYVASSYVRESFIEEGFRDQLISLFPLTPDSRFGEGVRIAGVDSFEIVYVGALTVHKGVPLLLDAVRSLPELDLRLRLIGGWKTPEMRRFIQRACAEDGRVEVCVGDPLPHLARAALCVHPAYEDGFAYAPAEALACGVPVIVSEDTGMKDLIDSPRNGLILPTGDLEALTGAIQAAYRGEILAG